MLMKKPYVTRQVGLVCFVFANLFGLFGPRTHLASQNWIDGIHGLLLGLSIGLMLLSLRSRTRP